LTKPERANEPEIAAAILAEFLKTREHRIVSALQDGDLAAARKLVNGGSHGLDKFTAAFAAATPVTAPTTQVA
jgi:predicted chitinase